MTIAATVSSTEITRIISGAYVNKYLEARLINASGTNYTPGLTNDATFLALEVAAGTAGYKRAVILYENADVGAYTDDGVALTQKATAFEHDGSGTNITFTHVAFCRSTGNATALSAVTGAPTAGVDGTYTNIPFDTTTGSGIGLTIDLTIQNSGAASTDYIITINKPGYNHAATDSIVILESTLQGLGAVAGGAGNLGFDISTVYTDANAGDVVFVAKPSSTVNLNGGNEAIFYWNLKQFGFYSQN